MLGGRRGWKTEVLTGCLLGKSMKYLSWQAFEAGLYFEDFGLILHGTKQFYNSIVSKVLMSKQMLISYLHSEAL